MQKCSKCIRAMTYLIAADCGAHVTPKELSWARKHLANCPGTRKPKKRKR